MLPRDFVFSQASLQDFVDCRRRFQYRYLFQLRWPALPAEPPEQMERLLRLGSEFHRLVHQHQLGMPVDRLSAMAHIDRDLADWWQSYLASGMQGLPGLRYPEVRVRGHMGDWPIVGNYDLLAIEPGRHALIVDWKTTHHLPGEEQLRQRLQSQVYPVLLVQSGARFNQNQPIDPDMIRMRYWFPEFPDQSIEFAYDRLSYEADIARLEDLIAEVVSTPEDGFDKTDQTTRCRYCVYRSLCNRGQGGGGFSSFQDDPQDAQESWESEFDFDQIAEVAW